MTTMRSVEPVTGIDAAIQALFDALLPGSADHGPQPGEHGVDRHMRVYVWTPGPDGGGSWQPDLPWWGALPGLGGKAEAQWQGEAEAG